ncbi:Os03g0804000 [Oryza sativa Japonica Group]|uniref:Os03g0804000 protein n=2 Tax=Oryza sativa subsp. japonica TaxID=39947 RepID=Q0DMK9_ORYSJ|nr:hypothetical protein EE612_021105 [Oryza sativa]BAF13529.1 Os03g0804000 [Oryza sativa Japonica Group]BAS86921.1 Os03g0804000 [Oryza sativa Japonica Group]|eukprot:NP_001051615.1 Os03g0804000 [Oryza sativa Japonica Group]
MVRGGDAAAAAAAWPRDLLVAGVVDASRRPGGEGLYCLWIVRGLFVGWYGQIILLGPYLDRLRSWPIAYGWAGLWRLSWICNSAFSGLRVLTSTFFSLFSFCPISSGHSIFTHGLYL